MKKITKAWDVKAQNKQKRLNQAVQSLGRDLKGKFVGEQAITQLLYAVLEPYDRVCIEGNNQKQADFLAKALASLDPAKINNLHMLQSVLALPEHMDVFEKGIAHRVDLSYSGPQSHRLDQLLEAGKIQIGTIHTYLELYGRFFVDLTPHVALITADAADHAGNLYTSYNTEETPVIVEATTFKQGIVIAQVNEIRDDLPRVDIPGGWVDFIVQAPTPYYIEPLFTRDPAKISEIQILMAMMAIKGIYAKYEVSRLNHGIGFDTATIELILPTYAKQLGIEDKICKHWILNPHPTLIPAIEAGLVESIHCFGGELGMEEYTRARPDIFFIGPDGGMRSNRAFCQAAGQYAIDMFIGSTLQMDIYGNSSTATKGRITGFGGAPNMGTNPGGRRHTSTSWLKAGSEYKGRSNPLPVGRKLVVQIFETFGEHMRPSFVEKLDAWEIAKQAGLAIPPVGIYGEDISHIITEEGIANLLLCENLEEREQAIRGVAGYTPVGLARDKRVVENLRDRGVIQRAEDIGVHKKDVSRDLLAAKSIKDLVRISGGLYKPPKRFRNW